MQIKRLSQWYLIISAIIVGFILYVSFTFHNTEQDCYQWNKIVKLNDGWLYEDQVGNQTIVDLPTTKMSKANVTYKLTNTLPPVVCDGSVLSFKSDHLLLNVYIQDQLIYSLQIDQHSTIGKSPGLSYVFVPLKSDMGGKTIRIEYTPVYADSNLKFSSIQLGDKSTILTGILRQNLFAILICALSFCLGLIFIVTYFIKRKTYELSKSLMYLGVFAIPLSIWSLSETQTLQFFFSNVYALQFVPYLSLALCPLPFFLYYIERYHIKPSRLVSLIGCICCFSTFGFLVFQAFGIMDLPEALFLIHISIALVLSYTLIDSMYHYRRYRIRVGKFFSLSSISMVFMLICTIIDLIRYYVSYEGDYAKYVRIGFFLYLGCTGLGTIFRSVQIDRENKELELLAYADAVTGVLNEAAFARDIKEFEESHQFSFVIIEVIKLDEVMHRYGTQIKDELLFSVARILGKVFHGSEKIYRISETMFILTLPNYDEMIYASSMSAVEKRVHNSNKSRGVKIELKHTYAVYNRESGIGIKNLLEDMGISLRNMKNNGMNQA